MLAVCVCVRVRVCVCVRASPPLLTIAIPELRYSTVGALASFTLCTFAFTVCLSFAVSDVLVCLTIDIIDRIGYVSIICMV